METAQHKYILVLCVLSTGNKDKCQHEVNLNLRYLLYNSTLDTSITNNTAWSLATSSKLLVESKSDSVTTVTQMNALC